MGSRLTEILTALAAAEDGTRSNYDLFAEIFAGLDARLAVVEGVSGSLATVQAQLEEAGLAIVEAALDPVRAAIADKADLGAVLSATSVSEVAVGTGPRTLVIAPEAARAAFAPAHILSIVASDDPTRAMYARRVSYDAVSGALAVDVLAVTGAGTYTSWTIAPASLASMAAAVSIAAEGEIAGPTVQAALGQIAAALAARQGSHANLSALAGLALAAGRVLVTTDGGGLDQATITAAAKAFLALTSTDAMRAALAAAPLASPEFTGSPKVPTPEITADSNQAVNVTALRSAVANLVGTAPAVIDTIAEAAAALGNDPNFATTVFSQLAGKQPLHAMLTALSTTAAGARAALETPYAGPAPDLSGWGADFNQDLPSGWYSVAGTIANGPSGTASYSGVMLVVQRFYQFARSTQIFYALGSIWVRYGTMLSTAPVWSAWVKLAGTTGSDTIATSAGLVAGNTTARDDVGYTPKVQVHGLGTDASAIVAAWRSSNLGVVLNLAKSRGAAVGANAIVQNGDIVGDLVFCGDDGTDLSTRAGVIRCMVDGSPAVDSIPSMLLFYTTAAGATSISERLRIDNAGNIQVGGANTVISAARHILLRSYTVATLPSASPAAQAIYVSNGTSNKRLAISDGTSWRWPDGAVVS